ncbi:MAG: acyltransferase [bacterium]|nr:acyltransferase [bacterium]
MDKRESAGIKALAIIMMFWHHLFGCDTFLSNGIVLDYIPIFKGYDATIGIACKLCIALFAFSSGYGIQKSYIEKAKYNKIILSIYKFLLQYWVIMFFVAIPYLIYFNKFNIEYLPINLFALLHNDEMLYVSLSWYVKVNLMFLCISPVIKFLSKRIKSIVTEIFIIVFPIIICNYLPDCESFYRTVSEGILSKRQGTSQKLQKIPFL